jgi:hypothetical protein
MLAITGGTVEGGGSAPPSAIERGLSYLLGQQAGDGGWHSRVYGLLRSGQSLTALVLDTLSIYQDRLPARGRMAFERALGFVLSNSDPRGGLGLSDDVADYPTYATSLFLSAVSRRNSLFDTSLIVSWLRDRQFSEHSGWTREHPAYGGWGIGGPIRNPPDPGHVDLSMTRFALQAIAIAGVPRSDPTFERARVFLGRCQNPDGGYFFSPVVTDANKAGEQGESWRSYGTATGDGVLALQACGVPDEKGRAWLNRYGRTELPPGFDSAPRKRYAEGLRYYYAECAAQVLGSATWRPWLSASQRADGSWVNRESLVKEDDPIIATSLALRALAQ